MNEEIDSRLRETFRDLFSVDPGAIDDDSRRGELEGWDSLGHVDLVGEMEKRFAISIDPDDALEIETFADARQVVLKLLDRN
jgi:acyl carrier protein